MLGTLGSNRATDPVVAPLATPAPNPVSSNGRPGFAAVQAQAASSADWTPWVLLTFIGLYLVWALVERHQRVRQQVQPKNVAINLRNLVAIVLPVILGLALLRVALVKLKLLTTNLPGFLGNGFQAFLGAVIRLVG